MVDHERATRPEEHALLVVDVLNTFDHPDGTVLLRRSVLRGASVALAGVQEEDALASLEREGVAVRADPEARATA